MPEIRHLEGLPVTSVARTLIDLADDLDPHRLQRVCHRAAHRRLLDARPAPGRRTRKLRSATASLAHADPQLPNEGLETRFLTLVNEAGLPPPLVNVPLGPYVVDFVWLDARVVVETDDIATHLTAAAFAADRRRDVELTLAGYLVLRFTWHDVVHDGAHVVAAVYEAVMSRASSPKTST
jgi:hypothetical protein